MERKASVLLISYPLADAFCVLFPNKNFLRLACWTNRRRSSDPKHSSCLAKNSHLVEDSLCIQPVFQPENLLGISGAKNCNPFSAPHAVHLSFLDTNTAESFILL